MIQVFLLNSHDDQRQVHCIINQLRQRKSHLTNLLETDRQQQLIVSRTYKKRRKISVTKIAYRFKNTGGTVHAIFQDEIDCTYMARSVCDLADDATSLGRLSIEKF